MTARILHSGFRETLGQLAEASVQLVITDPPYGTGQTQKVGPSGRHQWDDPGSARAMLAVSQLFEHLDRVLTPTGLCALILDYRIAHHAASLAQSLGWYKGEIIWHFETGGRSRKWWPVKHNTILLVSPREEPLYRPDQVHTVPRKAPKKGYTAPKLADSVWTVNMSTNDPQRTGWPTQKPVRLFEQLIRPHTNPGDLVVDPWAGSGTVIDAAIRCEVGAIAGDSNIEAVKIMRDRLVRLEGSE